MKMQIQAQSTLIKEIAKNRNIKWLVHFTHINNLASILKCGIMPRFQVAQLNEGNFVFPDFHRADNKNASCLSIMFPNNKMLYHKRQQYPDNEWVFLLLKPDVLWECDCAFYPTNAASTGLRHKPLENFKSATAFEAMFADNIMCETTDKIESISRPQDLKSYLPTDVQAEVLVFNTISPNYIIDYLDIERNQHNHKLFCGFRNQIQWK